MAFTPATLALSVDTIAEAIGRIFFYSTSDDEPTVTGSGYFTRADKCGVTLADIVNVFESQEVGPPHTRMDGNRP